VIPELFGNASLFHESYFGRVFYWDATFYLGVVGLVLALHGLRASRHPLRNVAIVLTALLAVMAMGGYTPVYSVFYELVPGFTYIRAPSKFLFYASVFAGALVALGLDRLLGERAGAAQASRVAAALALLAAVIAGWTWAGAVDGGSIGSPMALLDALPRSGDFVPQGERADWRRILLRGALVSAGVGLLGTLLLRAASRRRQALWLLVALAVVEVVVYARVSRGTFRMTVELDHRPAAVNAYREAGTQRVLETAAPSLIAMGRRHYGSWGYDPVILGRYITYMAWSQGVEAGRLLRPTRFVPHQYHPSHAMLRTRYSILWSEHEVVEHDDPMPRFQLMDTYRVLPREQVLSGMADPGFDPRREVILETQPIPAPGPSPGGTQRIWVADQSTDHVDLELELDSPALLLVTDSYSDGWRALALPGSDQQRYEVLPANYVLRAVPLAAGRHHLRLEYSPLAYRVGGGVSAASLALFVGALVFLAVWRLRGR
jgi:hypothetical protein